jgi:RHS repeat-associated protein
MRSVRSSIRLILAGCLALLIATVTRSQSTVGAQKFGTYDGFPDTVDVGTLGLHLEIPLFTKAGRGHGTALNFTLNNYTGWPTQYVISPDGKQHWLNVGPSVTFGVTGAGSLTSTNFTHACEAVAGSGTYTDYVWTYVDAHGASHLFPGYSQNIAESSNTCATAGITVQGLTAQAADGSGYLLNVTSAVPSVGTVTDPSGKLISPGAHGQTAIQDSNGNILAAPWGATNTDAFGNITSFTALIQDTVNTKITMTGGGYRTDYSGRQPLVITYLDDNGNLQNITISYRTYNYSTGTAGLVDTISYPSGAAYHFTYALDSSGGVTGTNAALASMTLPSGGVISYTYPGGISFCGLGGPEPNWIPSLTRTTPDGTTTYSRTIVAGTDHCSIQASETVVSGPTGDQSSVYFVIPQHYAIVPYLTYIGHPTIAWQPDWAKTLETKRLEYDHTNLNSPLRTTMRCYNAATGDCTSTAVNEPVAQLAVTTTLGTGPSSKIVTTYTAVGTPTEVDEYDYGASSPGRKTITTYNASLGNNILDRPASVIVYDSSGNPARKTTYAYDETTPAPMTLPGHTTISGSRGNPTSVYRWILASGQSLRTQYSYDDAGQVVSITDPKSATTNYAYDSATDAYRTSVTLPNVNSVAHVSTFTYNPNSGLVVTSHDENNQLTSYAYDSMFRQTSVIYPDGGQTTTCYTDEGGSGCVQSGPPYQIVTTRTASPSPNQIRTTVFDGLGRVVQTQLNSDNATDYVDTTYDAVGRVHSVSNPHRSGSSSTDGTTSYIYDALARVCVVVPSDGTAVSGSGCPASRPTGDIFTTYAGNMTTVTDEAGKTRKSQTDGLGRMTNVWEDPSGLNYQTVYSYDALDNLTSVVENGSRNRSYAYDSIARLTSAMNPESGTISYTYDANDNIATRTTPAPNQNGSATVTTTYSYDALNRLTGKVYSDTTPVYANGTPTTLWGYDQPSILMCATQSFAVPNGIGRLSWSAPVDQNGIPLSMTAYGYDPMGRTALFYQCPPLFRSNHQDAHVSYTYDEAGDLQTALNGANVTISYSYDGAGRATQATSSLQDANHPGTLVTVNPSLGYWPTGSLHTLTYGNGLTETFVYNKRIQLCRTNLNSSGTSLTGCSDTVPSGSVQDFSYALNLGTADNGNMAQITATGNQTFNRSYSYDTVNRLQAMTDSVTSQQCRGLSWTYDPWANRTSQVPTAGSCFSQPVTTFSSKNQLPSPYQYDAAGNLIADGSHTYTFDAENRIIKVDGGATASYAYNADGLRTEKKIGTTVRDYVYEVSGEVVAEFGSGCSGVCWNAGYVHFGGQVAAEYRNATTYFFHKDHLGSTRLLTAPDKSIADSIDYLPFGEQIAGDTGSSHKFTGKERDTESGLDNFGARYDASSLGRFMSPDPVTMLPERLRDPQQINLYAYTRNNPLRFIDPTGTTIDDSACLANKSCKKWEDKYKKSKEGQAQWKKLDDDKKLLVKLQWDSKAKDSVTSDYKWDSGGKLTGATVTLAPRTGDPSYQMSSESYPFGSTITDSSERQVYVFGHELAHVEDSDTPEGRNSIQEVEKLFPDANARFNAEGSSGYAQDKDLQATFAIIRADNKRNENVADQRAKGIVESYRACESSKGCK